MVTSKIVLFAPLILIGVGGMLLFRHSGRLDLEAQVAGLTYPLQCTEDATEVVWSTAKMNEEIDAGRTIAPEAQMRRFVCPTCATTNLVLKGNSYE